MSVYLDTEELFLAVCPELAGDQNSVHDRVRIESSSLESADCPTCNKAYQINSCLMREIDRGAWVNCTCGGQLKPADGLSDAVREAFRVFGKRNKEKLTPSTMAVKELNGLHVDTVILRCPTCQSLNRFTDRLHSKGFYSCGRCKTPFNTRTASTGT